MPRSWFKPAAVVHRSALPLTSTIPSSGAVKLIEGPVVGPRSLQVDPLLPPRVNCLVLTALFRSELASGVPDAGTSRTVIRVGE